MATDFNKYSFLFTLSLYCITLINLNFKLTLDSLDEPHVDEMHYSCYRLLKQVHLYFVSILVMIL
jgi:hypothetical protein